MTDEELIARLRSNIFGTGTTMLAADRIEELYNEWNFNANGWSDALVRIEELVREAKAAEKEIANLRENYDAVFARAERLKAALHNCVGMLDQLVAESGRDIEWGAEDPFRMGEWFEPEDLAQIEQARADLKGNDHE